jgi:hypothetical protein
LAHDLQEHTDSTRVIKPVQYTKPFRKWTRANSHRTARGKLRGETKIAIAIHAIKHGFNDAAWDRLGLFTLHYQARNTQGAINATPAMLVQIQLHEQVTGKKRSCGVDQPSGVPHCLPASRQKNADALIVQLDFCAKFAVR